MGLHHQRREYITSGRGSLARLVSAGIDRLLAFFYLDKDSLVGAISGASSLPRVIVELLWGAGEEFFTSGFSLGAVGGYFDARLLASHEHSPGKSTPVASRFR